MTPVVHVDGQGGRIWTKPPCAQADGLLSLITTGASHRAAIVVAGFNMRGDKFTIGDSRGNIYQFHVLQNRYSLLYRAGFCPTAIATSPSSYNIAAVAFEDNIIRVFDTESALLVASLKGHRRRISCLSFNPKGYSLISMSKERAIVWDAREWRRRQTLENTEFPLLQTAYGPSGDVFTSVSRKGVIAWHASTFKMLYQLKEASDEANDVSCFAISTDCRYLLAGLSESPLLHFWDLKATVLLRIVVLPQPALKLQFLFNTDVAVVLVNDGSIVIFNIMNLRMLLKLRRKNAIRDFEVAPGGRYCTCLMDDGSVSLFDLNRALETESVLQRVRMKENPSASYEVLESIPVKIPPTSVSPPIPKQSMKGDKPEQMDDCKDDGYDSDRAKPELDSFNHGIESASDRILLDPLKLKSLLKTHGEYPAEYRAIIWRTLLRLPANHNQFNSYLARGMHPALEDFNSLYPLLDRRLFRRLCQVLSALFYWCPLLSEVDYLPAIVFPFLRIYPADNNAVFEMVVVLLLNWGRHWLEFFPNPPVLVLREIERLINHQDSDLFSHFQECGLDSSRYSWPLLKSFFTEVLPKSEWLILFDHVISNKPSFIIFLVVQYLCTIRKAILSSNSPSAIERLVTTSNVVGSSVSQIISGAYRLRKKIPAELLPNDEPWVPLQGGIYPEFENYPKFVDDFQLKDRERIEKEFQESEPV